MTFPTFLRFPGARDNWLNREGGPGPGAKWQALTDYSFSGPRKAGPLQTTPFRGPESLRLGLGLAVVFAKAMARAQTGTGKGTGKGKAKGKADDARPSIARNRGSAFMMQGPGPGGGPYRLLLFWGRGTQALTDYSFSRGDLRLGLGPPPDLANCRAPQEKPRAIHTVLRTLRI